MKNYSNYAQLFLRLALGIGFIFPVLDRLGFLGPVGTPNVGWGNWPNFLNYTHVLLPFLSKQLSDIFGLLATIAETTFGILFIIGLKVRLTAIASFLLLVGFALCMAFSLGLQAPFNYSVFSAGGGALLLSTMPLYRWSIDWLLGNTSQKN